MKKERFQGLFCIKCDSSFPLETHSRCSKCGGILNAKYDISGSFPKKQEELSHSSSIWYFSEFFPPVEDSNIVSLGEGWTPYVKAASYSKKIGIQNMFCKIEGANPSGSFKDRIASLGLSLAKQWKKKGVFTASSGNAAAAIAAYSARAGISCLILIREDSSASKLGQISMYGPRLLRVRDLFKTQQTLDDALSITQKSLPQWLNHFVWAPYNPLLIDAMKTIAYEIALSKEVPDYIFVPTAGGDLLYAIFKGFAELRQMGVVDKIPKMVAAQGAGASPTVEAIREKRDTVLEARQEAKTVAGALRVNFGAEHTLDAVYKSEGFGVSVTDGEIIDAQRLAAKTEGIFCEVSSATALAGIAKALRSGNISKDESAAAILTGIGFKEYFPAFKKDNPKLPLAKSISKIPLFLKLKK